jgi:hypothetical protein
MTRNRIFSIFLFIFASASAAAADIPMIGFDSNGNANEFEIPQETYEKNLALAVQSVRQSTLSALNAQRQTQTWLLQSVTVGISADIEVGNELIFKVTAVPRFRLVFSNSKEPLTP